MAKKVADYMTSVIAIHKL